jgi:hypothetical protein
MVRSALRVVLLALAFAIATLVLGWWTVPVIGAAWGLVDREDRAAAMIAASAAVLGWGALLLWDASYAAFGTLARRMGGVFSAPAAVVVIATLLLAAALAWGAAVLGGAAWPRPQRRN